MSVNRPIALQVYSVREAAEKDLAGTLQAIKGMGYDGVELAGLYGLSADRVKKELDTAGLQAISAHVPWQELADDTEKTLADYKHIGCQYVAIPSLPDELRPGTPGFATVLKEVPRIGRACREQGMTLLYHNHDFEFVRLEDGQFGLDALYSTVPEDELQTELDVCWIKVAGQSPVDYIRKYEGRCPIVHLKDFHQEEGEKADEPLYELIGEEGKNKAPSRNESFQFRPVGHGLQDMPAIVDASQECGAKWLVVEQDRSDDRDPLEAVKMSVDYLRSL